MFVLSRRLLEEHGVDLLDVVVALLVELVDGVLDGGKAGVGGAGAAGLILLVPEVEVGAMLEHQLERHGMGDLSLEGLIVVPGVVGLVVHGDHLLGVEHRKLRLSKLGLGGTGRGLGLPGEGEARRMV